MSRAYQRRIALEIARAARHERASALRMAQRLRTELRRPRSLGIDRALLALLDVPSEPAATLDWLQHAIALAESSRTSHGTSDDSSDLVALIVFGPP